MADAWSDGEAHSSRAALVTSPLRLSWLRFLWSLPFSRVGEWLCCFGSEQSNEIDDTFRPILTVVADYGRFVLIVIAAAYLFMGHGWAAAVHLAVAVVMFALFCRHHRAREQAIHERLQLEQEEEGDDNPKDVA